MSPYDEFYKQLRSNADPQNPNPFDLPGSKMSASHAALTEFMTTTFGISSQKLLATFHWKSDTNMYCSIERNGGGYANLSVFKVQEGDLGILLEMKGNQSPTSLHHILRDIGYHGPIPSVIGDLNLAPFGDAGVLLGTNPKTRTILKGSGWYITAGDELTSVNDSSAALAQDVEVLSVAKGPGNQEDTDDQFVVYHLQPGLAILSQFFHETAHFNGLQIKDAAVVFATKAHKKVIYQSIIGIQEGGMLCASLDSETLEDINPILKTVLGAVDSLVGNIPLAINANLSDQTGLNLLVAIERSFNVFSRNLLYIEEGAGFNINYNPHKKTFTASVHATLNINLKKLDVSSLTNFDQIPFTITGSIKVPETGSTTLSLRLYSGQDYANPFHIPGLTIYGIGGEISAKDDGEELNVVLEAAFRFKGLDAKSTESKKVIIGVNVEDEIPTLLYFEVDIIDFSTLTDGLLDGFPKLGFLDDIKCKDLSIYYCQDKKAVAPDGTTCYQGLAVGLTIDICGFDIGGYLAFATTPYSSAEGWFCMSPQRWWNGNVKLLSSAHHAPPSSWTEKFKTRCEPLGPYAFLDTKTKEAGLYFGFKFLDLSGEIAVELDSLHSFSFDLSTSLEHFGDLKLDVNYDSDPFKFDLGFQLEICPEFDIEIKIDSYSIGHIEFNKDEFHLDANFSFDITKSDISVSLSGSFKIGDFDLSIDLNDLTLDISDVSDFTEILSRFGEALKNKFENELEALLSDIERYFELLTKDFFKIDQSIFNIIWHLYCKKDFRSLGGFEPEIKFFKYLIEVIERDITKLEGDIDFDLHIQLGGKLSIPFCPPSPIPDKACIPDTDFCVSLRFDLHFHLPKLTLIKFNAGADMEHAISTLKSILHHEGQPAGHFDFGPDFDWGDHTVEGHAVVYGVPEFGWDINSTKVSVNAGIGLYGSFLFKLELITFFDHDMDEHYFHGSIDLPYGRLLEWLHFS